MAKDESGLSILNANLVGATDPQMQSILDAQQAGLQALEQRYANPNWFNVAAGFFKPQLGGFAASLGSASQALGENVEKQRENMLPIAKMRSDIALTQLAMGQKKTVADMMANRKPGEPLTPEFVADVTARAPGSSVALALKDQLATQQAQRGLASSEQGNAMQRVQMARSMGVKPNPNDLAVIAAGSPTDAAKPGVVDTAVPSSAAAVSKITPGPAPLASTPAAAAVTPAAEALDKNAPVGSFNFEQTTLPSIERSLSAIPDQTERDRAKQALDKQVASMPKKVLSSEFSMESGLTPEQLAKVVKPMEDIAEARYAGLVIGAPEQYAPRARVLNSQIDLIKNNSKPDRPDGSSPIQRVTSVLSQGKIFDGILAALNEGIGISVNGLSANLRAPIETFIRANFEKEDRELAMAMANNYASIALTQQQIGKVNPNSARNAELGLYNSLTPGMDTTPNAAMRSLLHLRHDLDMTRAQYEHVTGILGNKHPTLKLKPDELARFSTAFDPQYLEKINEPFTEKHNKVEASFQKSLGTK